MVKIIEYKEYTISSLNNYLDEIESISKENVGLVNIDAYRTIHKNCLSNVENAYRLYKSKPDYLKDIYMTDKEIEKYTKKEINNNKLRFENELLGLRGKIRRKKRKKREEEEPDEERYLIYKEPVVRVSVEVAKRIKEEIKEKKRRKLQLKKRRKVEEEKEERKVPEEMKEIKKERPVLHPTETSNEIRLYFPTIEMEAYPELEGYNNLILTILFIYKIKELSYFMSTPKVQAQYAGDNPLKMYIYPLFTSENGELYLFENIRRDQSMLVNLLRGGYIGNKVYPHEFLKEILSRLTLNCRNREVQNFTVPNENFCTYPEKATEGRVRLILPRYDPRNFINFNVVYPSGRYEYNHIFKVPSYIFYQKRTGVGHVEIVEKMRYIGIEEVMRLYNDELKEKRVEAYTGAYLIMKFEQIIGYELNHIYHFSSFIKGFGEFKYGEKRYKMVAFITEEEDKGKIFNIFLRNEIYDDFWSKYYVEGNTFKNREGIKYTQFIQPYLLLYKVCDRHGNYENLHFIDPLSPRFPENIRDMLRKIPEEEERLSPGIYVVGGKRDKLDNISPESILMAIIVAMLILIIYYIVESVNIVRNTHTMRKQLEWRHRRNIDMKNDNYYHNMCINEPADYTISI
jgi:hypothetical protein